MKKYILFSAIVVYALVPPLVSIGNSDTVAKLKWVETSDPLVDAKRSIKANDFRLLAVLGYTWVLPGVKDERKFKLRKKYGIKIIEGTSDVLESEEHARLIKLARNYAYQYNREILGFLKEKNAF